MNIKKEKIEKLIELDEISRASSQKVRDQLKAIGKDEFYIMALALCNPERDNEFDYIKNLSQIEQDDVKALMRFGQDFDIPSKENFEYYVKYTHFAGLHDIDYMIGKPLSRYLKNGLMKLDVIERNN